MPGPALLVGLPTAAPLAAASDPDTTCVAAHFYEEYSAEWIAEHCERGDVVKVRLHEVHKVCVLADQVVTPAKYDNVICTYRGALRRNRADDLPDRD